MSGSVFIGWHDIPSAAIIQMLSTVTPVHVDNSDVSRVHLPSVHHSHSRRWPHSVPVAHLHEA